MEYVKFNGVSVDCIVGSKDFFDDLNEKLMWYAINYLEDVLAQENNCEVLYQLGDLYYELECYDDAVKYFSQAADKGHANAMFMLGRMMVSGFGFDENIEKGFLEIHKAADEYFCPDAMYYLGYAYRYGGYVKKDCAKGLEYLKKAAEKGNWEARWQLSSYYQYSENEKNLELAIKYAKDAYLKIDNKTCFRDFFPKVTYED